MKYYLNENTTPLAFHAFLKWVSLPLGIIRILGNLSMITRQYEPGGLVTLECLVLIVDLALLVVALVGLIRMAGFGWAALMAHLCLMVGYAVVTIGIVAQYDAPDAMSAAVGNLFTALLYGGLVGLYYMKRRYLFFPEKTPPELLRAQERETGTAQVMERLASELEQPPAVYCWHCGQKLLPGSVFCSACGTQVGEEQKR